MHKLSKKVELSAAWTYSSGNYTTLSLENYYPSDHLTNREKDLSGGMGLVKIIMTNVIIINFLPTIVWMWALIYIVLKRRGVWEFGILVFITCTAG